MLHRMVSLIPLFFLGLCLCTAGASEGVDSRRSDTWLKAQLVTVYTLNEFINPFDIDVKVVDGVAYLSGTVDSSIEKDLAVEIARGIDGIREVREEILIEPVDVPPRRNEFAGQVEDATLTAKVKYRLLLNKHLDSLGINVDTDTSVVTLSGTVDSREERYLAVKLAENTSGVSRVIDNLLVAEPQQQGGDGDFPEGAVESLSKNLKDTWITAKAKSLLMVSSEAEGATYHVTTRDGVVTISGAVLSRVQAEAIENVLLDLQGVRAVRNNLTVR